MPNIRVARRRHLKLIVASICCAGFAQAAVITSSAECRLAYETLGSGMIVSQTTQTGLFGCSLSDTISGSPYTAVAAAFASADTALSGLTGSLAIRAAATASEVTAIPVSIGAFSMANITFSASLITDGVQRAGFAEVIYSATRTSFEGSGGAIVTFAGRTVGGGSNTQPGKTYTVPITLGSIMPLFGQAGYSCGSGPNGGLCLGENASAGVNFSFFEADGKTPVAFSEVAAVGMPEPGTLLLLSPLVLIAFRRRYR